MAVLVGSARIDERGMIHGGKEGDQGKEVSTQPWYLHSQGWIVLRPKSEEDAEKIAYAMQALCDNQNFGYDQWQRVTGYNAAAAVGFDPKKVKTPTEIDCSEGVRICLAYAGIHVKDFTTANEASVLMATGKFSKLTAKKYTESSDYLKRGDILITKTQGHTVVVLTNGKKVSAAPVQPVPKKPIEEVAKEVIEGKWGNGSERRKLLEAAGYSYSEVQAKVNEILRNKPEYYVIKKGDTLSAIARKYGTTVGDLARLNGISNPNRIVAGHRIRVK